MSIGKFTFAGFLLAISLVTIAQNPGTVGTNQIICYGTAPQRLTFLDQPSGGQTPYSFRWERSNDGTNFKAIAGSTGLRQEYSPPVLGRTAWFRCRVTDANSILIGTTNAVIITITPDLVPGTIGESQAINYGSTPSPLVQMVQSSGGSGSHTYRWQISADGRIWDDIDGATSAEFSPSRLFHTTMFRRWVIDGMCGSIASNTVTIEVNPDVIHYDFTYPDSESLKSDGWDFIARPSTGGARDTEQTEGAVVSFDQGAHPGVIRIPADEGDLWENLNDTRNTLFRDLPSDWTSVRLKIASFDPVQDYQQAGLAIYQDDDNYVCLTRVFEEENRITLIRESDQIGENVNTLLSSVTDDIYFRIDWDSRTGIVTTFHSTDGQTWNPAGTVTEWFIDPRLAIIVSGDANPGSYPVASIAWVEVSTEPLPPISDYLRAQPGEMVFSTVAGQPVAGSRAILITSEYGTELQWNATASDAWIVPETTNGDVDGVLRISVDNGSLSPGVYDGVITLTSPQAPGNQIDISIVLIVNPDVPVSASTWKNGRSAAMSVSVDDGDPTAFDELVSNGFQGTYLSNGLVPPAFYTDYYQAGMELGSHLVNHHCEILPDEILRNQEIEPSIAGIAGNTPQPVEDLISLAWTCGVANYRMQIVAADYFLAARGYNVNELEDSTPENFMYLKSYNSREHEPAPPVDLKTVVDQAVSQHKWFNLVLHTEMNEDGAISYAGTRDVWGASVGSVIKYIMQRDRFVLSDYAVTDDVISFNASRTPVPASDYRSFETAFGINDSVTIQVNIDDGRDIESVLVNGTLHKYSLKEIDGDLMLFTNIMIDTTNPAAVEIRYYNETAPRIYLSTHSLNFMATEGANPVSQSFDISSLSMDITWNISFEGSQPEWISVVPVSGTGNGSVAVNILSESQASGTYNTDIIISSPEAYNSPQVVSVRLRVNPDGFFHYDFTYPDRTSLIEDGWSYIARTPSGGQRNTEETSGLVVSYDQESHPGVIRIPVGQGDLWEGANDTRNSLFRDLPSEWTSIRLKVSAFSPFQNYQQASLVLYQDDDNYLQISRIFQDGNLVSFSQEDNGVAATISSFAVNATTDLYFRLDWFSQLGTVVAYYSLDGTEWIYAGNSVQIPLSPQKLGIVTGASPSGALNADIEWAQISIRPLEPLVDNLHAYPSSLVFNIIQGQEVSLGQSIFLYTELGRNLEIIPSESISWLSISGQDLETECTINASLINTAGLTAGVHTGIISILTSADPWSEPIEIPVSLIVNPDVGVSATNWKDGFAGVMSVTVDDGYDSAFELLDEHGLQGTYVYNGTVPPAYYGSFHDAGMELGSHLVNATGIVPDNVLRHQEIEPNIEGLYSYIPSVTDGEIITLVWPYAISTTRMQAVASEYFLSARGDDSNQLEDVTPENFMNLKFFAHEYMPDPPDLKDIVDSAIAEQKWFIMCLHSWTEGLDDGAIEYAVGKDIWVTSVGNVVKYILQRDRLVISNYNYDPEAGMISFNVSRLPVQPSIYRSFETAFNQNDITTIQIDTDDSREIESVMVGTTLNDYTISEQGGNSVLLTNVRLDQVETKNIQVTYTAIENESTPEIEENREISGSAALYQNMPNPFNSNTWIEFELVEESRVTLELFNSSGYKVETIINQSLTSGSHKVEFTAGNHPVGIYYLRLKTPSHVETKRMIILK